MVSASFWIVPLRNDGVVNLSLHRTYQTRPAGDGRVPNGTVRRETE